MAKRRNYRAEQARRDELAQQAGWKSRAQERYAHDKFKNASLDVQGKWNRFLNKRGRNLTSTEERRAFRSFWQGLVDPRTREDVSKESPKAEWFVYWLDLDIFDHDYDIWDELYGDD